MNITTKSTEQSTQNTAEEKTTVLSKLKSEIIDFITGPLLTGVVGASITIVSFVHWFENTYTTRNELDKKFEELTRNIDQLRQDMKENGDNTVIELIHLQQLELDVHQKIAGGKKKTKNTMK